MYFNTSACSMIVLNNLNIRYVVLECIIDSHFSDVQSNNRYDEMYKEKADILFSYISKIVFEMNSDTEKCQYIWKTEMKYITIKTFMLLHSCLFIWLSFGNALTWHTYSIHLIGCSFHVIICQTNRRIHHHSLCVET